MFDAAVNFGVLPSILLLQKALGVKPDGVIGPKTLEAAREATPAQTVKLMAARLEKYEAIAAARATSRKYIGGWRTRTLSTLRLAVLMETPRVVG